MSSSDSSEEFSYTPGTYTCEKLISASLLALNLKDRNEIRDEVHGVLSLAPTETEALREEALLRLGEELSNDTRIPVTRKRAYLRSQEFSNPTTYVNADEFRLRFLRLEFFDATKAAMRMLRFLDLLVELFGEFALQRPIRLADFPKHELQFIRKGQFQFLPFRDRSGRRVMMMFLNEGYEALPPVVKAKIFMYLTWTAGNDVDTQRLGLVYSIWFDSAFNVTNNRERYKLAAKLRELTSVRTCAVHICSPDRPNFQWGLYVITLQVARKNRSKVTVHLGSTQEVKYKLQTFGIPQEEIPISHDGKIKNTHFKNQWMEVRKVIEEGRVDISECPLANDVIFRQGKTLTGHRGNALLHDLIQQKNAEQEEEQRNLSRIKRKLIVEQLVQEIQNIGGRFLVWNEGGWWDELRDQKQIFLKVEYKVGEYRKAKKASKRQILQQQAAHRKRQESGRQESSPSSPPRRCFDTLRHNMLASQPGVPCIPSAMHVATEVPHEIRLSPVLTSGLMSETNLPLEELSPLSPAKEL